MEPAELPAEEELLEDDWEKPKSKFWLKVIAVAMVLLFILNSLPGLHLISYMSGQLVSSDIINGTIALPYGGKVILLNSTYEQLKGLYLSEQKNEIKVCLVGKKSGKDYLVDGLYVPTIYRQTFNSVSSQMCSPDTIISLHSHPYLRCLFSNQDILSYGNFIQANPEGIIGLMCDVDRFTFYGYEQ